MSDLGKFGVFLAGGGALFQAGLLYKLAGPEWMALGVSGTAILVGLAMFIADQGNEPFDRRRPPEQPW